MERLFDLLPDSDLAILGTAGVFLGILLAFEGLRQVLTRSETGNEVRNRRMRMIAKGATGKEVLGLLRPQADGWALRRTPFIGTFPTDLRLSGLMLNPWLALAGCMLGTAMVTLFLSTKLPGTAAIGVATFACLMLPLWLVKRRAGGRVALFALQLPDALDLMARGLRVGHPLNVTIQTVGRDMQDPIATEFGLIFDQISYGDDLVSAFRDLAERMPLEDMRYLSVSIAIQHGTGGNLSEVLNTLSKVIRDRITMRKRIQAISSEGRLTSLFLSGLPLMILIATSITAPNYYLDVSDDPLFRPFAITVGSLIIVNYLAMRKLVNFRL